MQTFEKKITISYQWQADNYFDIPEKHFEALQEDAEDRIFEMLKEGYSSGDLYTTVRMGKNVVPEEDEEYGIEYSGLWNAETE